mgnify:CR=1 FL=1
MFPNLTKDQVKEVSHFVYHRMSMIEVYEQAKKLVEADSDYADLVKQIKDSV